MSTTPRSLRYDVVDVFTDTPFAGNQLAVVHGASGLPDSALRTIAVEFGFSETAFPLPPSAEGADYRLRIFTPREELPFAGHPSVGSSWVLAEQGVIGRGAVVQECGAGLLTVVVDERGARISGGEPNVGATLDRVRLAAAVGLTEADLSDVDAGIAGCGLDFAYLAVLPDAVARAVPDADALRAAGVTHGVEVFAVEEGSVHARMFGFSPTGAREDAATGSAALGLCVFAASRGLISSPADIVVRQGIEIGRPSTLFCTISPDGVSVRGDVVSIATGEIRVPG